MNRAIGYSQFIIPYPAHFPKYSADPKEKARGIRERWDPVSRRLVIISQQAINVIEDIYTILLSLVNGAGAYSYDPPYTAYGGGSSGTGVNEYFGGSA